MSFGDIHKIKFIHIFFFFAANLLNYHNLPRYHLIPRLHPHIIHPRQELREEFMLARLEVAVVECLNFSAKFVEYEY